MPNISFSPQFHIQTFFAFFLTKYCLCCNFSWVHHVQKCLQPNSFCFDTQSLGPICKSLRFRLFLVVFYRWLFYYAHASIASILVILYVLGGKGTEKEKKNSWSGWAVASVAKPKTVINQNITHSNHNSLQSTHKIEWTILYFCFLIKYWLL